MIVIRIAYRRSETGEARGAAQGRKEQRRPEPMPHHIIRVTMGPAAIEASIPANCR
jgi:hypothetical protein